MVGIKRGRGEESTLTKMTSKGVKKIYTAPISEKHLIGMMVKNKKKSHCIRGHTLPPRGGKRGRVCIICRDMHAKKIGQKYYNKYQAIKNSKFPLITLLTGEMR